MQRPDPPPESVFRHAVFHVSVADPLKLPPAAGPEVAFVGRSNAGKSSAINTLVGEKRLAYVSRTPGRTQLINFFQLRGGAYLVDLPGYGYAAVPEAVRASWAGLIERYLATRDALVGVVLIMDARRPLTELDFQLLEWFAPAQRPVHALLTKADKLNRAESNLALRETRAALADYPAPATVSLFSSLKRTGTEEVATVVGAWIGQPDLGEGAHSPR